jgi:hypothetical protein
MQDRTLKAPADVEKQDQTSKWGRQTLPKLRGMLKNKMRPPSRPLCLPKNVEKQDQTPGWDTEADPAYTEARQLLETIR